MVIHVIDSDVAFSIVVSVWLLWCNSSRLVEVLSVEPFVWFFNIPFSFGADTRLRFGCLEYDQCYLVHPDSVVCDVFVMFQEFSSFPEYSSDYCMPSLWHFQFLLIFLSPCISLAASGLVVFFGCATNYLMYISSNSSRLMSSCGLEMSVSICMMFVSFFIRNVLFASARHRC